MSGPRDVKRAVGTATAQPGRAGMAVESYHAGTAGAGLARPIDTAQHRPVGMARDGPCLGRAGPCHALLCRLGWS